MPVRALQACQPTTNMHVTDAPVGQPVILRSTDLGANSNQRLWGCCALREALGTVSAGPLLLNGCSSLTAEVGTRNSRPAERTCGISR